MTAEHVFTRFQFDGHKPITVLRWNGQPAWIAQEVAEILAITRPARTIRALNLDGGIDFDVVKGDDLKILRGVWPENGSTPEALNTSQAMLLYESGVYALAFYSRTPEARRFRNWVAREVLPALRSKGFYAVAPKRPRLPWPGVLNLLRQAHADDSFAVGYLAGMGFTEAGAIPADYAADPGPAVVAQLIALARQENRWAGNYLAHGLGLAVPAELQLSLPV